jgi:hypothetical protein
MNARRASWSLGACLGAAALAALLLWGGATTHAQTLRARFKALSPPMKRWTVMHPFAARRALAVGQRALALTDSMRQAATLGTDFNGGQLDAFRHGMWMALLVREMRAGKAASLGRAYERGNHWQFKAGLLEDGSQQDAAAGEMDLRNNAVGRALGSQAKALATEELARLLVAAIKRGDFFVMAKDSAGNALDAQGQVIPLAQWRGTWVNRRCVVASDQ